MNFTLRFFIVAIVCLAAIVLFAYIAHEAMAVREVLFDAHAFRWMQQFQSPANTRMAIVVTFLGSGHFLLPVYAVLLICLLWFKRKRDAIVIAIIATSSYLLGSQLKNAFQRQRPNLHFLVSESGYSFPSGHSLGGFTLSGILIYLVWRGNLALRYKWILSGLLFLLACFIGMSRIYLHVHFASDVLGSFFICLAWLTLSFEAAYYFERRRKVVRVA